MNSVGSLNNIIYLSCIYAAILKHHEVQHIIVCTLIVVRTNASTSTSIIKPQTNATQNIQLNENKMKREPNRQHIIQHEPAAK